ncbi:TIGR03086 family metal-binding protein [Modestobacter marinus]|uniref:TIGR03086 family metal-binding protein n=1 Tax=Modestobacter marinus TaxID=477641 RepID=UPI001C98E327|nr:TIGR03086 family metal-binding protein [Modestobacter marinus]
MSNATATSYEAADRSLSTVLAAVPADAWSRPSPCEGWSARDVVRHLVDTQRDLLTGHGLDLGPAPDVDADPAGAWRQHAGRVAAVIADDEVAERGYEGFFGPTTIGATLEQFYVWDMVVHRWDVARATGQDARLTDAELDRVAAGADSFGEALYMDGICRPGVTPPSGADRATQVLARLGRAA